MNEKNFVSDLHNSSHRDYLGRMINNKVECMKTARKFGLDFWDGERKYGYGGYKYIEGRWQTVAKNLIKEYGLNNNSKILDVGCGKGYLLYDLKRELSGLEVYGYDISKYAIDNSHPKIKDNLFVHDAGKTLDFSDNYFDLVISLGTLHNLEIADLKSSIQEIQRLGKKKYIMVESYRNEKELFNLQCWALTCKAFYSYDEWLWLYNSFGYSGDFEFIYF
tara:strand:+ start:942 stop:1601 length:660 start_codon:yes stop_codon:yes gene_type:complete